MPPTPIPQLNDRSPRPIASDAPMNGANANTEPVRAAPNARCQQVEPQAQAVSARSDGQQRRGRTPARQGLSSCHGQSRGCDRADRALAQHHLTRIALGQRARERVVHAPSRSRAQHRHQPDQLSASVQPPVRDQHHAASEQQQHGRPDAPVHHFAIERPGQHRGEQRFKRQHQRRARATGVLQAPSQRNRPDGRAEKCHQPQAGQVSAAQCRLALDRFSK